VIRPAAPPTLIEPTALPLAASTTEMVLFPSIET
jgi:hypothetical protein